MSTFEGVRQRAKPGPKRWVTRQWERDDEDPEMESTTLGWSR